MFKFFLITFFGLFFNAGIALGETPPANPPANPPTNPAAPTAEQYAALREENEKIKAKMEEFEKRFGPKDPPEKPDLITQQQKEKETAEEKAKETKTLTEAIKFNMAIDDFVKTNEKLLPPEIADIVKLSNKEKYDSEQAKSNALKASIIQSFFKVQANIDVLTNSQRSTIDYYLTLTKNGKEEKAAEIYENILEPRLHVMREIKKAQEVSLANKGYGQPTAEHDSYKARLLKASRETHLGIKEA